MQQGIPLSRNAYHNHIMEKMKIQVNNNLSLPYVLRFTTFMPAEVLIFRKFMYS